MLARVSRLEGSDAPTASPFERAYGSLANFNEEMRCAIEAGVLDRRDGEDLLVIIRRWHSDRVWDLWR